VDLKRFYDVPLPTLALEGGPDHGQRFLCPYDPPPHTWCVAIVRPLELCVMPKTLEETVDFHLRQPRASNYTRILDANGWPSRTDDGAWRYGYSGPS
jgi:hypothetical protein